MFLAKLVSYTSLDVSFNKVVETTRGYTPDAALQASRPAVAGPVKERFARLNTLWDKESPTRNLQRALPFFSFGISVSATPEDMYVALGWPHGLATFQYETTNRNADSALYFGSGSDWQSALGRVPITHTILEEWASAVFKAFTEAGIADILGTGSNANGFFKFLPSA